MLARFMGDARLYQRDSIPTGYVPYYSWFPMVKAGGLGARYATNGSGTLTNGNLAGGLNAGVTIVGTGQFTNAACGLIIEMVSTLNGSGDFASNPNLQGVLEMLATITSTGEITTAELGAIVDCVCNIYGAGTVEALLTARGYMDATIYVNEGSASVDQMVSGVWNALASDYNEALTMGNKLNSAGSAGDPWGADPTTFSPDTAGELLKKTLKTSKFIALK